MASEREVVARAIRDWSVCGATLNGETVFCDDPALPEDVRHSCDCFAGADAVLSALSDRSRSEVGGDVVARAAEIVSRVAKEHRMNGAKEWGDVLRQAIAAALDEAERRRRPIRGITEETVNALYAWMGAHDVTLPDDAFQSLLCMLAGSPTALLDPRPAAQPEGNRCIYTQPGIQLGAQPEGDR